MLHRAAALLLLTVCVSPALAQGRGFSDPIDPNLSGLEIVAQKQLWAMEVSLKPLRMIKVQVTDPKTGEKKEQLVWYLVYKAVNRPVERPAAVVDRTIQNVQDDQPASLFVPEFVLVTDDNGVSNIYRDQIIPEALKEINIREKGQLKHNVQLMQPVPEPVAEGEENAIYGVAMWSGIDPATDFFTIYMHGLSNGYEVKTGPDGEPLMMRRVLSQDYWRPGDEFEQDEVEIRTKGKPVWRYLPEPAKSE